MKPTSRNSKWLAQLKAEGVIKGSKTLSEEPTIFPDVAWIWDAFIWLSRRRQFGMNGPQSISPSDIAHYVWLKRIDVGEDIDLLTRLIDALDAEWMADWYKREEAKRNKPPPSGKKF